MKCLIVCLSMHVYIYVYTYTEIYFHISHFFCRFTLIFILYKTHNHSYCMIAMNKGEFHRYFYKTRIFANLGSLDALTQIFPLVFLTLVHLWHISDVSETSRKHELHIVLQAKEVCNFLYVC